MKPLADVNLSISITIREWLNSLMSKQTDNILIQLFRYTLVGGLAFVVDFGSLWLLTDLCKIHYLWSAGISFIFGLTTNYILSLVWVFNKRTFDSKFLEFGLFAFIGIIGLGLNEVIIWFFTEHVHFHYLLSKVVSTITVFLWNFLARRFMLFR